MSKLTVVAISGASGCGKSAVIEHLATLLDCDYLRFDDYIDADSYPKQMRSWLDAGADPAAIQSPRLEAALLKTIAEAKHSSEAPKFLLLEEPFGRQRPQLSALIVYYRCRWRCVYPESFSGTWPKILRNRCCKSNITCNVMMIIYIKPI